MTAEKEQTYPKVKVSSMKASARFRRRKPVISLRRRIRANEMTNKVLFETLKHTQKDGIIVAPMPDTPGVKVIRFDRVKNNDALSGAVTRELLQPNIPDWLKS